MRQSFHDHWTEDQSQLHINILEIMAIPFALKKVIQNIHHSCVMISTNSTTNSGLIYQQTSRNTRSLEIQQTSQYRMVLGSNGGKLHFSNAQFSHCEFVCNSIQSQTPIVYLSSSRQSSLCDRCIVNELEQSTCLCISTNNSDTIYSNQNPLISGQNSSNYSS